MRYRLKIIKIVTLVSFLIISSSYAAAEKIGYVNLSRLLNEYPKTADYEKMLEEKAKRSGLYEKEREIERLRNQLLLLSEKERQRKEQEIRERFEDLRRLNLELTKERDEKMKEILKDIEEAIREYASKNRFSIVLDDRVLVYRDESLDLTDKVLRVLRGKYKRN